MTASTNGRPKDVTELRQEIKRTRADLGDTVEALAAKADVKARARDAVEDVKLRARDAVEDAKARAQVAVRQAGRDAVQVSREFRAHPLEQAHLAVARMRQSVREHPAPWIVGAAFVLLAAVVASTRRR
jgi:hypothetical protein